MALATSTSEMPLLDHDNAVLHGLADAGIR